MSYETELLRTMSWLAEKPDTFFLGQSVCAGGTGMFESFQNVSIDHKIEVPVFEETQMRNDNRNGFGWENRSNIHLSSLELSFISNQPTCKPS